MLIEFHVISFLIVLSALFAYINHKYIKLPGTIGLMVVGLIFSMGLVVSSYFSQTVLNKVRASLDKLHFSDLLMNIMSKQNTLLFYLLYY